MKKTLMTILRNRNTSIEQFRLATEQLTTILAVESDLLVLKIPLSVETPLQKTQGVCLKHNPILIPILRSGLALLPPFIKFYPSATVGFVGVRRDEVTAIPELYYAKFPAIEPQSPIFLLDPMLATGGSASLACNVLLSAGVKEEKITLISFIAAPEGMKYFQEKHSKAKIVVAQIDDGLNEHKFIVPGLGDFGDRYFGTPI